MYQHKQTRTTAFRFRRYCRAAYAAYNSLHRVVNIGHLATYIADRQLHKSAAIAALGMLLLPLQAAAQADDNPDERLLPAIDIVAQADTLFCSPSLRRCSPRKISPTLPSTPLATS